MRPFDIEMFEQRQRVLPKLLDRVRPFRRVRLTVAARVVAHHPEAQPQHRRL
jgi:hypothetical protein